MQVRVVRYYRGPQGNSPNPYHGDRDLQEELENPFAGGNPPDRVDISTGHVTNELHPR